MNKIKILLLIIICSTFNNLYSQEHKERYHFVANFDGDPWEALEGYIYMPANYEVYLPNKPLDIDGIHREVWIKYESNQYILIYYNNRDYRDTIGIKDTIYIPSKDELSDILDHHHPYNFFDDFKPTELGYENPKQNPESLLIVKGYINILLFSIKKENIDYFAECAKTLKITKHRDLLKRR